MNIVNNGSRYQIYGEDLRTMKTLPAAAYNLCFAKFTGFYLESRPIPETKEEKIYGKSEAKTDKVLAGFRDTNRNFGVMLSGPRGVGKSLFAKLLIEKGVGEGYPVIVVSTYYPGIADFISSIEQEAIVLFDEYEKTFAAHDGFDPQTEMLPLFDGTDSGKKLFVITCNDTRELNKCLMDRPGRFYYHIIMTPPSTEEIKEYMNDKLQNANPAVIERVVGYAMQTSLTYDCLRAIAAELNRGYSIDETMEDLNISRETSGSYKIHVALWDGTRVSDDFSLGYIRGEYSEYSDWFDDKENRSFNICFSTDDMYVDLATGFYVVPSECVSFKYDRSDFDSEEAYHEANQNAGSISVTVARYENKLRNNKLA